MGSPQKIKPIISFNTGLNELPFNACNLGKHFEDFISIFIASYRHKGKLIIVFECIEKATK